MMDITVLVPAYKSKYLPELLAALRCQSLRPKRVVFSDDSPDQAFIRALDSMATRDAVAELNIEVIAGPRQGAWANFRNLLQHFQGETEFFHLQLDDDIPYPQFYERHAQAHGLARAACAVSRRWNALESGQPVSSLPVPAAVSAQLQRVVTLDAALLFSQTVPSTNNWLGEFSNASFRAGMREELLRTRIAGISYTGLEDIGAFLAASQQAPLIYINEHLGYFRTSAEQNTAQRDGPIFKLGVLAWIPLALAAHRLGYIDAAQSAAVAQRMGRVVSQHYAHDPAMAQLGELALRIAPTGTEAQDAFIAAWHHYCGADALPGPTT